MRRFLTALLALAALSFCGLAVDSASAATGRTADVGRIVRERAVVCWPEGQIFDDLVLNARGKLTFLYADRTLATALRRTRTGGVGEDPTDDAIPAFLLDFTADHAKRKGRVLFALQIEAAKPWTFDTRELEVGGFTPGEDDIHSGVLQNRSAELPYGISELESGYVGYMSFFVPGEYVKPGSTVTIGYGGYLTEWTVPK